MAQCNIFPRERNLQFGLILKVLHSEEFLNGISKRRSNFILERGDFHFGYTQSFSRSKQNLEVSCSDVEKNSIQLIVESFFQKKFLLRTGLWDNQFRA